ncbi:MAG: succinate dehydrogenase/fumarate reductase iron-sulfur subunit [Firmicutes bacterium]|nr:succinate dehydrogenase/fumarate reductase iron-sulfur subunit [Bacillota bacterium]
MAKTVTVVIDRSDAGAQRRFEVPVGRRETVLDALFYIQNDLDPTLSFRCACRVGMCGSCGILVNGGERLACRTALEPLGPVVELAPLRYFPRVKDLVVDFSAFYSRYRAVAPYLKPRPAVVDPVVAPPGSGLREEIDLGLECISCGLCLSACDVVGQVPEFLGPAALNRAYNLVADVRDAADAERLEVVGDRRRGVWQCHSHMSCVEVCPKGLAPTRAIAHLRRKLVAQAFFGRRPRPVPSQQRFAEGAR